jgi:hypothetical protein
MAWMDDTKRLHMIEKIKKLLRLAKSSNEHEAALAAARAQELLSKYNLDGEDFSEREIPKEAGMAETATVKKPASWVYQLASAVSGAFDCKYFHSVGMTSNFVFVGVDVDHEVGTFTFGYLYRTINRLAATFMSKSQQKRLTLKGQRKARLSYCVGVSQVVSWKLSEQRSITPITTTALVPVKQALITAKMEDVGVSKCAIPEEDISDRAYWVGRRDGANVDHGRRALPKKKSKLLRIDR